MLDQIAEHSHLCMVIIFESCDTMYGNQKAVKLNQSTRCIKLTRCIA